MATDLLSEALSLVHLAGALVFEVDLHGPCGVTSHPLVEQFAPMLPPGATQVIAFHVVLAGGCWVRCGEHPWLEVRRGHAIVVTRGEPHTICDRPESSTAPFETLIHGQPLSELRHVCVGTPEDKPIRLLCGFLGCDRRAFDPLCGALPGMFEVDLAPQMDALIHYAVTNALDDDQGAAGLRGRLAELLFLGALRAYMRALPPDATGWLAGLRDPLVGRVLRAMHAAPFRHWTVDGLATAAATSRSVLAERFRAVIGEPPMHYLTRLRLQLAARQLEGSRDSVARIADAVGYESSAAFQRAFKRCFGLPPAAWRCRGKLTR